MPKLFLPCFLFLTLCTCVRAQSEIRWTVNLNTDQIRATDKSVFQSLEKDLLEFLNGQTWTEDRFTEEERIEATLFLTISEKFDSGSGTATVIPNEFNGTIAIQSLRPVYGTGQQTPILNTQDNNGDFSYQQGEGVQYSAQTYLSDLGTIMAFYSYIILGLDYDTFAPLGGQPLFDKAQELYNRLPDNISNLDGWKPGPRGRNRYSLMENILDPRMKPLRRGYYGYHRLGLDMMSQDITTARSNITLAIEDAQKANQAYPGTLFAQSFVDAKRDEIIEIYKGATPPEQNAVIAVMKRLDPAKSPSYNSIRYAVRSPRSSVRGRQ